MRSRLLAVLGPPGSGKGTQCSKIISAFPDRIKHLSAGQLLRNARDNNHPLANGISETLARGGIVPGRWTAELLYQEITGKQQCDWILIDGFPRNLDNVNAMNEMLLKAQSEGNQLEMHGVLFLDISDQEVFKRLKSRGREDDDVEVISRRLEVYRRDTLAVLDCYRVYRVDGSGSEQEVWNRVSPIIAQVRAT
jgi:adenylate kinase family enzyme